MIYYFMLVNKASNDYGGWKNTTLVGRFWLIVFKKMMYGASAETLVGLNQITCLAVSHSNHYTRMFSVLLWGCDWILFTHWWFCPIRLIHLIFTSHLRTLGCPIIYTDIYSQYFFINWHQNNAWYKQPHWLKGSPYLPIITSNVEENLFFCGEL